MLASTLQQEELLSTDIQTLMQPPVLGRDDPRIRAAASEIPLQLQPGKSGQHAARCWARRKSKRPWPSSASWRINCDFCGQHYEFDKVDCAQLFAAETTVDALQTPGPSRH